MDISHAHSHANFSFNTIPLRSPTAQPPPRHPFSVSYDDYISCTVYIGVYRMKLHARLPVLLLQYAIFDVVEPHCTTILSAYYATTREKRSRNFRSRRCRFNSENLSIPYIDASASALAAASQCNNNSNSTGNRSPCSRSTAPYSVETRC